MKIETAVIPVAGKGTRFLPATKQIPKEMIPIIDRPMIHYAVEEAVNSGIKQIVFVTSTGKEAIENYFDRNLELETFLEKNGKTDYLEMIQNIGSMIEIVTVRQKEQLGLGHAINCASELVGKSTFSVILGDDLVLSDEPVTKQLIDVSKANNESSVIGVMKVPKKDTSKYGIVDGTYNDGSDATLKMHRMIEKPLPENAPTDLATPGRYILTYNIFDALNEIPKGVGGEYQLTDAINLLCENEDVYAHIFKGDRYDTGNIESYLNATMEFALQRDEYKDLMKKLIKEKATKYGLL